MTILPRAAAAVAHGLWLSVTLLRGLGEFASLQRWRLKEWLAG